MLTLQEFVRISPHSCYKIAQATRLGASYIAKLLASDREIFVKPEGNAIKIIEVKQIGETGVIEQKKIGRPRKVGV